MVVKSMTSLYWIHIQIFPMDDIKSQMSSTLCVCTDYVSVLFSLSPSSHFLVGFLCGKLRMLEKVKKEKLRHFA